MCIRCFAWEQAYDIARTHSTHLDTVLYHRQRHLAVSGAVETLPKLQKLAAEMGAVDEAAIKQKVEAEKERERARGGQQVGA
jgi:malonyl CoA-acyl carrier protein transacylase